jgi:hypothetical protein
VLAGLLRVSIYAERLSKALLSVASDDSRDVEVLKKAALKEMAADYRWQPMQSPMRH